jgi:exosortase C (VPDSG-CTERM-specific)
MIVKEFKFAADENQIAAGAPALKQKIYSARLIGFLSATAALALCFALPLLRLFHLAASDDLYSVIPLIPLLSLYLVWLQRAKFPDHFETSFTPAAIFAGSGLLVITLHYFFLPGGLLSEVDDTSFNILALLLFFTGICFSFLGKKVVNIASFPMALLIFMIPLPDALRHEIETFLQYGSALFAEAFFQLSSVPVFRQGLDFHLPNFILRVAPECSGIHSTLALMITGLLGGWLFLRSPWNRVLLALAVIPLALARNGFRIFVIGRLCAAYGPQMLNSPIHRHGGPLFFILSLIPLSLLLLFLRNTEQANRQPSTKELL